MKNISKLLLFFTLAISLFGCRPSAPENTELSHRRVTYSGLACMMPSNVVRGCPYPSSKPKWKYEDWYNDTKVICANDPVGGDCNFISCAIACTVAQGKTPNDYDDPSTCCFKLCKAACGKVCDLPDQNDNCWLSTDACSCSFSEADLEMGNFVTD